jgi:amino acid permease
MTGPFDILTVACFLLVVLAFLFWTDRDSRTLLHLAICGIAFAVANQLGNRGAPVLALILIAAGAVYALIIFLNRNRVGPGRR